MTEMQVWQTEIAAKSDADRQIGELKIMAENAEFRINSLLETVSRLREEKLQAQSLHREDIDKISNALTEEAESRDWCSEYDEFVESINRRLHYELTPREVEHDFTFTLTFTITTKAQNEDAAEEEARRIAHRVERFADDIEESDRSSELCLD